MSNTNKVVYIALIPLFLLLTFMSAKSVFSDNKIETCYVEYVGETINQWGGYSPSFYKLKGFIPWRSDVYLGSFKTQDELLKEAEKLKCPMNIKSK